jgi:L-ascorbate metabolism protein UlaG (beta-lactamase superfamily)
MQCNVQTGVKWALVLWLFSGIFASSLQADVTVTQLANEGVILSDGKSSRIMIDGLVDEPFSVYGGLPEEIAALYFQAAGPFSGIDFAFASHQHHDHNQPASACKFLQKSTETVFISSDQVIDLMREKCRQFVLTSPRIRTINPQYDEPVVIEEGDVKVTVFLLSHGEGKYKKLKNFGHLVEIGGMRVLHVGDAIMAPEDFARAGVDKMDIDVALIPFTYFRPGPGTDDIVGKYLNAPYKIAVHIPPSEMEEVKEYLSVEFPRVLILENAIDEAQFSAEAPPPP